jgi:cell division initiation protein
MADTPVELRHLRFPRGLFGYRRRAVDGELERIADSFEEVWRERADLADQVDDLQSDLKRHRELEEVLRRTLVSAERSVDAMREAARLEADRIVQDAEARARQIVGEAHSARLRLHQDFLRLRESEQEFRARFRSVVTSTSRIVEAYEAELGEPEPAEATQTN